MWLAISLVLLNVLGIYIFFPSLSKPYAPTPDKRIVNRKVIGTVYFNGMGSVRPQGLRYANELHTTDRDGNILYTARRYQHEQHQDPLLDNVIPSPDFDDVHVHYHGGGESIANEPRRLSSWRFWIPIPEPTPGDMHYWLVLWKWLPPCSSHRIQLATQVVRHALLCHEKIGIYGNSRGASLALMVLGHLTQQERKRIVWVIAEAPYDSISHVISDRYNLPSIIRNALSRMNRIYPTGPLDVDIPTDVPILIGSGQQDEACPVQGQYRIANKIRLSDNNAILEHVVIDNAYHNDIWQHPHYAKKVKWFKSTHEKMR